MLSKSIFMNRDDRGNLYSRTLENAMNDSSMSENTQETINQINELENSITSLESLKMKIIKETESGGVSVSTMESARSLVTYMFGEDVMYGEQSLESSESMNQISLESIGSILDKLGRYLKDKKSELLTSLSWLKTRYTGGFKRMYSFLEEADREIKNMESTPSSVDFGSVKKSIGEKLHIDGDFDLTKIVSSIHDLNEINSDFSKEFSRSYPKARTLVDEGVKEIERFIDRYPGKRSSEELASKVQQRADKLRDDIASTFSKLSSLHKSRDGKHYPGGKVFRYKEEEGVTSYSLDNDSLFNGKIEIGSKDELSSLVDSLKETVDSMKEFESPTNVLSGLIEEMILLEDSLDLSMEEWRDKDTARVKKFARLYALSILTLTILTSLINPMALGVAAVPILSIASITGQVGFWGMVVSTAIGVFNSDITSNKYLPEIQKIKDVKTQALEQMTQVVKYQNNITIAGISYINSILNEAN